MILHRNNLLDAAINQVAEVASYLWEKGWAERNAGNISINITDYLQPEDREIPALATYKLPCQWREIESEYFYITGTGQRMREVAKDPFATGSIIRITENGTHFEIIAERAINPTSELPTHLSIHHSFKVKGSSNRLVLHTHPTELTAMSHIVDFMNEENLNNTLWAMHPETFIVVPQGMGIIPYEVPGSMDLANLTLKGLENHNFVLWEKHGVLGVGKDLLETFDLIDTLNKSAQLFFQVRSSGYKVQGLNAQQIKNLIIPFNIQL